MGNLPALAPELILATCANHGHQLAVSGVNPRTGTRETITYAELKDSALRLSGQLHKRGIEGRTIALSVDKSAASYAAVLGIWLSGNHLLPVPPGCPPERLKLIFTSADPALAIGAGLEGKCIPWISLDHSPRSASSGYQAPLSHSSTAYLIFTSGSTGVPKGCCITHGNLAAYAAAILPSLDISSSDKISQLFEASFDPFFSDLLWAFLRGATLCPLHFLELSNFPTYVEREKITVWSSSPSLARIALDSARGKTLSSIRLSTFIGETLTHELAASWRAIAPASVIENHYGPAETTISVSRFRWNGQEVEMPSVPIGSAHHGVELASPGNDEELWIGGAQVSPGYLNSALDEGRFVERTFPGFESQRWYRTGDICRRLENDKWLFLGRNDDQTKIAGQRFEPGELEAAALALGWGESAALPWPHEATSKEGFVLVLKKTPDQLELGLAKLAALLPPFACPREIYLSPSFPLSLNGKLDRNRLSRQPGERIYPA